MIRTPLCTALLDANILYPVRVRDILLQFAVDGVFQPKWSLKIHEEWTGALLKNRPGINPRKVERTRALMDQAFPQALVFGYENHTRRLQLPDPNDRHVLAAAIVGHCDIIVTQNVKDFPPHVLAKYDLLAMRADEFLADLVHLDPITCNQSMQKLRGRLWNPVRSAEQYLSDLEEAGLIETAVGLRPFT